MNFRLGMGLGSGLELASGLGLALGFVLGLWLKTVGSGVAACSVYTTLREICHESARNGRRSKRVRDKRKQISFRCSSRTSFVGINGGTPCRSRQKIWILGVRVMLLLD